MDTTTTLIAFVVIVICPILYIILLLVGQSCLQTQYRIVTNGQGYKVQSKTKFYPFWDDCFYSYCDTKEGAKQYLKARVSLELKQKQENTWVCVDEN